VLVNFLNEALSVLELVNRILSRLAWGERPNDAVNLCRFERLLQRQWRQNRRQPAADPSIFCQLKHSNKAQRANLPGHL